MKALLESAKHILVGGHRGCACEYPENSIAAMEEGIRRGAAYLEIDVQLTKDGVPVIFHDTRLEEKTSLKGYVHDATYVQMKNNVEGLCTLEEAMLWGKKQNVWFGLELKTVPFAMQRQNLMLIEKISSILKKTNMTEHVFVFGLDYQVLKKLRQIDPIVPIGLIVPFVPEDPVSLMREMDAVIYLSYIFNMTPEMIRQLHDAGYYISGAILKDEYWVEQAMKCGVDMFESDNPEKYTIPR